MNARIATGRIGNMPIYEIDPQTWSHGADVLHYLFVESHCRTLEDDQCNFLGCDGVIYSVEGDDVLLHISKREASPWLRCSPGPNAEFFDSENPLLVYPLRDVKDWQWCICEELEALTRYGSNAILPEQFDLARNDERTFRVSLSSLKLQRSDENTSEMRFTLSGFPAGLSDIQSLFLERVLGGADIMKAVRYERADDWKEVVISFPSRAKVVDDLNSARDHRADIPAIGYGFGIGVDQNYTQMNVNLRESDLYNLPFSVIGTAWT